MTKANADKPIIIDPNGSATIACGEIRVRVQFNGNDGITVFGNVPVTVHPAVNDAAPKPIPADAPNEPKWLTKEFLASAKQGQVLPDGSVHIKLDDGSHWAIAANVEEWKDYGCGDDLGEVGQYIANQNVTKAHGHDDWQMPNSDVGYKIYKERNEGALKKMFSSVCNLWLAEHNNGYARVQYFGDGSQYIGNRYHRRSACAVRRLDHLII